MTPEAELGIFGISIAAGLIGAVSGLLFGFLTSGKKKKQAFS